MISVSHSLALRLQVQEARKQHQTIGFVPTMGHIHQGHLNLIQASQAAGCFTIASIFINPLQFDDKTDLARYPRSLEADQEKLSAIGCDLLFVPTMEEIYPEGENSQTRITVPALADILCGVRRIGHFNGVATIVAKLFNQVQPDKAFFGEKDLQQLVIIRKMVLDFSMSVEVVGVPTARAADGLALSSRNSLLTQAQRKLAPLFYQTLVEVAEQLKQGRDSTPTLSQASACLEKQGFQLDYLELRSLSSLQPVASADKEAVIFGAVFLGQIRLIDNVRLYELYD